MLSLTAAAVTVLLTGPAPGTLTGTIQDDATGEPLAGAVVSVPAARRAASADSAGRYVLRFIAPGRHTLDVRALGHGRRTLDAIVPSSGTIEINVALPAEPIGVAEVHVRGPFMRRSPARDASVSLAHHGRSIASMFDDPLLSEPDVLHALEGGGVTAQPESPSGLHVNGGASDQTAYALDGVPVFSPYHTAGVFGAWNPDALDRIELAADHSGDALSGTVSAITRTPGEDVRARGALSTTHARLAVDGPLAQTGAGFLVSIRSGFPAVFAPRGESTYVHGSTGDWLAKLEGGVFGGHARVLAVGGEDEMIIPWSIPRDPLGAIILGTNVVEWSNQSLGAEWTSARGRVLVWNARSDATAAWHSDPSLVHMTSARRSTGALLVVERGATRTHTTLGLRASADRTRYAVDTETRWRADVPLFTTALFGEHTRAFGDRTSVALGARATDAASRVHIGPHVGVRAQPSRRLTLAANYARHHQTAQSVRNTESVAGNLFPADLFVNAATMGVPVARSDHARIEAEYRASERWRLAASAYDRTFDGLLLVAPRESLPFATHASAFTTGRGRARGASVDASFRAHTVALTARYSAQAVRWDTDAVSYTPAHGAVHHAECGISVFPSTTSSIRLGVVGEFGRRATAVAGGFEWEACNLLDRGCEFGGDPRSARDLGGLTLPSYTRVDCSVRKAWRVTRSGAELAAFGTATNILGRSNILTYVHDSAQGPLRGIEMRPRAPLVVGVDWRY